MHASEEEAQKALAATQMKFFGLIESLRAMPKHDSWSTGGPNSSNAPPTREEFNELKEKETQQQMIILEALQVVSGKCITFHFNYVLRILIYL